ncbi:WD repeat domain phosphoinositide-interacting protein 4-like [Babylonia areolata]|uniref:WD repeat domain phosphoinositide-interacting protein 4-like n=1 Tax=Babylonia areolata TaxID=304850 RepID=UPI003FD3AD62
MATPKAINGVHSVRCNQLCTGFAIATERGVKVFSMEPLAVRMDLKKSEVGSCKVAEMFFESNVVALVGGGFAQKFDEKTVVLMNMKTKKVLAEITFDRCVLAVRFTKDRLIAVLPEKIYIFQMPTSESPTLRKLTDIKTGYNHSGLCEVSSNGMMVFPAPSRGHVQVVDLKQLKEGITTSPIVINAHEGEIACLAISNCGETIATASRKGTLLRVFSVATKKKELELRRGCDSAIVYSISFSPCDHFLSVCSDKGTVHIFAVQDPSLNKTYMLSQVGNLLPSNLGKPFEGQKSLAQFAIPEECPSILAYLGKQVIVAISLDGTFQKYIVTPQGQCKLKLVSYTLDMGDDFDS